METFQWILIIGLVFGHFGMLYAMAKIIKAGAILREQVDTILGYTTRTSPEI